MPDLGTLLAFVAIFPIYLLTHPWVLVKFFAIILGFAALIAGIGIEVGILMQYLPRRRRG